MRAASALERPSICLSMDFAGRRGAVPGCSAGEETAGFCHLSSVAIIAFDIAQYPSVLAVPTLTTEIR
jgi:hypothetical protein